MKKVLLCAINSKFIHTSLSVRSLYHYAKDASVLFKEFTINESPYSVMSYIYNARCTSVLFSCYIWNIKFVLEVCSILKEVSPDTEIILGGPEVSYDSEEILKKYPFIDAVIFGEGEETFKEYLQKGTNIEGFTLRKENNVIKNSARELIQNLALLPFPYSDEDLIENKNKILYYESSRGCPFSCSYCISSTIHSLRLKPVELVKKELEIFINHKVKIVKFVDRTFNADKKRTKELLEFLIDNAKDTTFHFEVAADILDDELLLLLKKAQKGLFQFEIGVQTTNEKTLCEIDRKTSFEKISQNVGKIKEYNNIHLHLDLIAGLPYENLQSFIKSFNDVLNLGADSVQLGFLKLLKGTKIRKQENAFGYKFTSTPPYEVLSNDFLSFDDIILLKGIDFVLDKFHNQAGFEKSIEFLKKTFPSPFELFKSLYIFMKDKDYLGIGIAKQTLYTILSNFNTEDLFLDILKFDFLQNNKPQSVPWSKEQYDNSLLKLRFEILSEEFIIDNLPEYQGIDKREIIKFVHFEKFAYDILGNCEKRDNIILFDKKYNRNVVLRS